MQPAHSNGNAQELRESIDRICRLRGVSALVLSCTLLALFAEDARLLAPPAFDPPFHAFTLLAFIVFSAEFGCNIYVSNCRPGSRFQLFLDLIATLSLIPDLWFIQPAFAVDNQECQSVVRFSGVPGTEFSGTTDDDALVLVRASRAARTGIKVGRLIKLTRIARLGKLLNGLLQRSAARDETAMRGYQQCCRKLRCADHSRRRRRIGREEPEASDSGMAQQLAGLITSEAVVLVLAMSFALPFLDQPTVDLLPLAGLVLVNATPPTPLPAAVRTTQAADVLECSNGGTIVGAAACTLRGAALCDYIAAASGSWVPVSVQLPELYFVSSFLATERRPENIVCYALSTAEKVVWDTTAAAHSDAVYSIIRTAFVGCLLGLGAFLFARDARKLADDIVLPLRILSDEMRRITHLENSADPDLRGSERMSCPSTHLQLSASASSRYADCAVDAAKHQALSKIAEVRNMQRSFEKMEAGLESFVKFIPHSVVQNLLRDGRPSTVENIERRNLTVMFVHISNIDDVTASFGTTDTLGMMDLLASYFAAVSDTIACHGGTLIEFVGDEVLAIWNAPGAAPQPHGRYWAAVCGLSLPRIVHSGTANVLADQRRGPQRNKCPSLQVAVGINTATVFVGNLGAPDRMKYGVLGDGVNTAARLMQLNRRYATSLLLSETTAVGLGPSAPEPPVSTAHGINHDCSVEREHNGVSQHLSVPEGHPPLSVRLLDVVAVKGKKIGTKIYECLRTVPDLSDSCKPFVDTDPESLRCALLEAHYPPAMALYLAKKFERAASQFALIEKALKASYSSSAGQSAVKLRPDDAAALLRTRCLRFADAPPPQDWDGIDKLVSKCFVAARAATDT